MGPVPRQTKLRKMQLEINQNKWSTWCNVPENSVLLLSTTLHLAEAETKCLQG